MPSGSNTASARYRPNSIPECCSIGLGQHLEAVVRVDPPVAGFGHHLGGVHRQPGGVGQQVAHRAAGRAGRGVEVDHPLLDGHLGGAGDQGLGHRGQPDTRRPGRRSSASTPARPTTAAAAAGTGQSAIRSRAAMGVEPSARPPFAGLRDPPPGQGRRVQSRPQRRPPPPDIDRPVGESPRQQRTLVRIVGGKVRGRRLTQRRRGGRRPTAPTPATPPPRRHRHRSAAF